MSKVNGQWLMVNSGMSNAGCRIKDKFALRVFLLFTFYFSFSSSFSQTISSSLDRNKILLGEQVTLTLKADISDANYSLANWFSFPDTINHLEVISRSAIDTIATNGSVSFVQTLTLTSFDSGIWKLPSLRIVLQNTAGKQTTFTADSLSLQVLPVDVSNMQDYHDIKSVIQVEADDNWWMPAIIGFAAIVLIALLLWWFIKRKKKKILPSKLSIINGSPYDWAMQQLTVLQQENYPSKNQTKLFYTKLDEIYRTYFDARITLNAAQLTSDEMMLRLKLYLIKEEVRTKFYQTLRLVDAVKFAKYIPADSLNSEAVSTTRDTLKYMEETLAQIKKENAY